MDLLVDLRDKDKDIECKWYTELNFSSIIESLVFELLVKSGQVSVTNIEIPVLIIVTWLYFCIKRLVSGLGNNRVIVNQQTSPRGFHHKIHQHLYTMHAINISGLREPWSLKLYSPRLGRRYPLKSEDYMCHSIA